VIIKIEALCDFGRSIDYPTDEKITEYTWTESEVYEVVKNESTVSMYDDHYYCSKIPIWDYYDFIDKGYFKELD
jgi:hypothetical protein